LSLEPGEFSSEILYGLSDRMQEIICKSPEYAEIVSQYDTYAKDDEPVIPTKQQAAAAVAAAEEDEMPF
jgi:hypothetical protein